MRIFVTKSVRSSRDTAVAEPGASEASTRDQAIATTMRNTIGQLQVMVRIPLGKTPFCERPTNPCAGFRRSRSSRFGSVFRHHEQEVAGLAILLAEDGKGRVPTLRCQARQGEPPPLRSQHLLLRWAGGAMRRGVGSSAPGQQLVTIHDFDHGVRPHPIGQVDPVFLLAGRNGSMDARGRADQSFHRVSKVGLLSDKAEIPDVLRVSGIMQVVDLHVLVGTALVPAGCETRSGARQRAIVCDQKRYAGIALPPVLVSVGELWRDGGQQYRVSWIRDGEDLMRFSSGVSGSGRVSVAPQQVVVAMLPLRLCRAVGRQYVLTAHVCHLFSGGIARASRPRDLRQTYHVSG